jgi:hypothetical protein
VRAGNRAKYPDLSAVQTEKLRQLTIVSLAQQHEVRKAAHSHWPAY